jgi:outer membrane murein-binding lipoprotein Lpp
LTILTGFPLVTATAILSAPISLELTGGSVIKGDPVSWNGQQVVVKAEFGSLTFKREHLSQATLQRLDLLSGDPQHLVSRIAELEATVNTLRKDNAALREQLLAVKQRLEAVHAFNRRYRQVGVKRCRLAHSP